MFYGSQSHDTLFGSKDEPVRWDRGLQPKPKGCDVTVLLKEWQCVCRAALMRCLSTPKPPSTSLPFRFAKGLVSRAPA